MPFDEKPICIPCEGETLVGILAIPQSAPHDGVVFVVGGPQYRAGSHRMFTRMARALAQEDIATLRFDCRGIGDSTGAQRSFEDIQPDIHAAVNALRTHVADLRRIFLWGLCDGASAALFYVHRYPEIDGLVLCNPWSRTEASEAEVQLRHYYSGRLKNPEFWRKLLTGRLALLRSVRGALSAVHRRRRGPQPAALVQRLEDSCLSYRGRVLLILSGKDLTAREFEHNVNLSTPWRHWLLRENVTRASIPDADHTLSRQAWLAQALRLTTRHVRGEQ